jgi:hypothetical protein
MRCTVQLQGSKVSSQAEADTGLCLPHDDDAMRPVCKPAQGSVMSDGLQSPNDLSRT